jgi:hypothetical protein
MFLSVGFRSGTMLRSMSLVLYGTFDSTHASHVSRIRLSSSCETLTDRKSCDWSSYQKSDCMVREKFSLMYAAYEVCMGSGWDCVIIISVWTYGPASTLTTFFIKLSADFSNAI